jgi:hypothetical protein
VWRESEDGKERKERKKSRRWWLFSLPLSSSSPALSHSDPRPIPKHLAIDSPADTLN